MDVHSDGAVSVGSFVQPRLVAAKKDHPEDQVAGYGDRGMKDQSNDGGNSHDSGVDSNAPCNSRTHTQNPTCVVFNRTAD